MLHNIYYKIIYNYADKKYNMTNDILNIIDKSRKSNIDNSL